MVLWDYDDKVEVKAEDKLVGSKKGEASSPLPTIVRDLPTHGRVNKYGFTIEEEALRA